MSVKLLYSLTSYYTVLLYSNFTDTLYNYTIKLRKIIKFTSKFKFLFLYKDHSLMHLVAKLQSDANKLP